MSDSVKRKPTIVPKWSKPTSQLPPTPIIPRQSKKKINDPATVSRRFSVYSKKPNAFKTNQYNFSPSSKLPPLPNHLRNPSDNHIVRQDGLKSFNNVEDKISGISSATILPANSANNKNDITTNITTNNGFLDINSLTKELNIREYDANSYLKTTLANANSEHLAKFTLNLDQLKEKNESDVQFSINQSFNQVFTLSDSIIKTKNHLDDLKLKLKQLNLQINGTGSLIESSELQSQLQSQSSVVPDTASIINGVKSYTSNSWIQLSHSMKELKSCQVFIIRDTLSLKTTNDNVDRNLNSFKESLNLSNIVTNIIKSDTYKNEFIINLKTSNRVSSIGVSENGSNGTGSGTSIVLKTYKANEFNQLIQVIDNLKKKINNRKSTNSLLLDSKYAGIFNDLDDLLTKIEMSMCSLIFADSVYWVKKMETKINDISNNYKLEKDMTLHEQENFYFKLNLKNNSLKKLRNLLVDKLTHHFTNYILWSNSKKIEEDVICFSILGLKEIAKSIYLNLQSTKLKNLVSNLHFEVDLVNYINQLSLIFSNIMLKTIQEYNSLFISLIQDENNGRDEISQNQNFSKLFIVEWVDSQIDNYNKLFKNQLMDLKKDDEIYLTCASLTIKRFSELEKVGANVSYLLNLA